VYEWKRGTPLSEALKVYEGEQTDVAVGGVSYLDRGCTYELRYRSVTFYTARYELRTSDSDGFTHIPIPDDANVGTFADQLLITLRSPWLGFAAGAMLAAPVVSFMAAPDEEARAALLTALFTPTDSCSLEATAETRNYLVLSCLDHVVTECRFWQYADGAFTLERAFKGEVGLSPSFSAVEAQSSDALWVTSDGYTQPTTLAVADAATPDQTEALKALPAFFDASGVSTQQFYATSADGTQVPVARATTTAVMLLFAPPQPLLRTTRCSPPWPVALLLLSSQVPYFLVGRADLPLDGSTPTLLYGYGPRPAIELGTFARWRLYADVPCSMLCSSRWL
jgi:prolyl oligopeptidase